MRPGDNEPSAAYADFFRDEFAREASACFETAVQNSGIDCQANAVLAEEVAEFMANQPNRLFSISELSKECPAVAGATPQKIRPLLTTLISQKQVERTEEKGKPMFKFIGEVEE